MIDEEYFVPDTNMLISRSLARSSPTGVAFHLALDRYQMLISDETFQELEVVLLRAKFDRFSTLTERLGFLAFVRAIAKRIGVISHVQVCRDPKDDKFLALALAGRLHHPHRRRRPPRAASFRGIDILNPRQFLDRYSGGPPL